MSINSLLSMSQQALQVNQYALNVVSNNISNMNTEGYAKQRVELAENGSYTKVSTAMGMKSIGSGVKILDIISYRDQFLDDYCRDKNSLANAASIMSEYGGYIDEIFKSDLDQGGLSGALNNFYDAAQSLASNPTDLALRTNFMQQAQAVAQTLNDVYNNIDSYKTSLVGNPFVAGSVQSSLSAKMVEQINQKLTQIADVNLAIVRSSQTGTVQNDLVNQRAVLMDELAEMIPFETTHNPNGTVSITIAGQEVIQGAEQKLQLGIQQGNANQPIIIQMQDMNGDVIRGGDDITADITSGQLGAFLQLALGTDSTKFSVNATLQDLDEFAQGFAKAINDIQTYTSATSKAMGLTSDKQLQEITADDVIFVDDLGGTTNITAKNIAANDKLLNNPWLVATARVELDANGDVLNPDSIGNNTNVLEFVSTRNNGIAELGGVTAMDYLTTMISNVGNDVANLNTASITSNALATSAEEQRNAKMGVNIDEELVDLIKFQRAYEASARIFSTANEVYDELVNLGR